MDCNNVGYVGYVEYVEYRLLNLDQKLKYIILILFKIISMSDLVNTKINKVLLSKKIDKLSSLFTNEQKEKQTKIFKIKNTLQKILKHL